MNDMTYEEILENASEYISPRTSREWSIKLLTKRMETITDPAIHQRARNTIKNLKAQNA